MPPAPQPRFDSHGNLVADWSVTIGYSPHTDEVLVYWRHGEGTYHASGRGDEVFATTDIEDALRAVQTRTRILSARRLL